MKTNKPNLCIFIIKAVLILTLCYNPVAVVAQTPLLLNDVITMALSNNPSVKSAELQLAQAKAKLAQATAGRRFQISLDTSASVSNATPLQAPPSNETFHTYQNTLTIPLPIGRKPRIAVEQAQRMVDSAAAQYASARLGLVNQATSAYYDVLRKEALLLLAKDNQQQAERQLLEVQKRNKAGDIPELDVLRSETPLAAAKAATFTAQNDLLISKQTINSLIGLPLDADTAIGNTMAEDGKLAYTLEQARKLAVENSPDVRVADDNILVAQSSLQLAQLTREPSYALQASDARSNDVTSFSRQDSIQATITIPLSDGGLAAAQVKEAKAALDQAKALSETARQNVLLAVSSAYLTAEGNQHQVEAVKLARDNAQIVYDKTLKGYQNGLFPLSDVLNAQTAVAQARINYIQAVYDAASSRRTVENMLNPLEEISH